MTAERKKKRCWLTATQITRGRAGQGQGKGKGRARGTGTSGGSERAGRHLKARCFGLWTRLRGQIPRCFSTCQSTPRTKKNAWLRASMSVETIQYHNASQRHDVVWLNSHGIVGGHIVLLRGNHMVHKYDSKTRRRLALPRHSACESGDRPARTARAAAGGRPPRRSGAVQQRSASLHTLCAARSAPPRPARASHAVL